MFLTETMEQSKKQAKINASKPQGVFDQLGPKTAEDCFALFGFASVISVSSVSVQSNVFGAGKHGFVLRQMPFCQLELEPIFPFRKNDFSEARCWKVLALF